MGDAVFYPSVYMQFTVREKTQMRTGAYSKRDILSYIIFGNKTWKVEDFLCISATSEISALETTCGTSKIGKKFQWLSEPPPLVFILI